MAPSVKPTIAAGLADGALKGAAVLWFLVALAGQWIFVAYIVGFFGPPTVTGEFELWDRNKMLKFGHVPGDAAGNIAFGAHVMLAALITFGGTLQLIPQIRARAIAFHRWNGRLFILTAFVISLAGLFLIYTRESPNVLDHLPLTLNAVLIMLFAGQTIGFAMARNIAAHRRWALRTFVVVNGVWFLRVGMVGWMAMKTAVLGGPAKLDASFYMFWSFGSYLVPLAVLELYLRAQDRGNSTLKSTVAALIVVLTLATGFGIFGMTMFFWWPLMTATL